MTKPHIAWAVVVALAGSSAPASAAGRLIAFVFSPAGGPVDEGPCASPGARSVHSFRLEEEYTKTPTLPPALTSCLPPAGAKAQAEGEGVVVGLYRRLGAPVHSGQTLPSGPDAKRYLLLVLSDPSTGQDREYNRWYDQDHLPAVLRNPGFDMAERFVLVASNRPLPRYGATYDFTSKDWKATVAEVRRRLQTGETPKSPAFNYDTGLTRYYIRQ